MIIELAKVAAHLQMDACVPTQTRGRVPTLYITKHCLTSEPSSSTSSSMSHSPSSSASTRPNSGQGNSHDIAESTFIHYLQSQLDTLWSDVAKGEEAARAAESRVLSVENAKLLSRVHGLEKTLEQSRKHLKAFVDVSKAQQKLIKRQANTLTLYKARDKIERQARAKAAEAKLEARKSTHTAGSSATSDEEAEAAPYRTDPSRTAADELATANAHLTLSADGLRACANKLLEVAEPNPRLTAEYASAGTHITRVQILYDALQPHFESTEE